jgi:hypothetical protein
MSPASDPQEGPGSGPEPRPEPEPEPEPEPPAPRETPLASPGGRARVMPSLQTTTSMSSMPRRRRPRAGVFRDQHLVDLDTGEVRVESLQWTFACILAPAPKQNIPEHYSSREMPYQDFVIHTCERIYSSELEVQIVRRTETSKHKTVLLLRCPEPVFRREFRSLALRRWKRTGEGLTLARVDDPEHGPVLREVLSPTEADRIQLTAMILSRPVKRGGCGWDNIEHMDDDPLRDPRVVAVFPLHNMDWVERSRRHWKEHFSAMGRLRRWAQQHRRTVQIYRTVTCRRTGRTRVATLDEDGHEVGRQVAGAPPAERQQGQQGSTESGATDSAAAAAPAAAATGGGGGGGGGGGRGDAVPPHFPLLKNSSKRLLHASRRKVLAGAAQLGRYGRARVNWLWRTMRAEMVDGGPHEEILGQINEQYGERVRHGPSSLICPRARVISGPDVSR